ncbi:hypothetical protein AAC387_Pa04g2638 [Persea americana]
MGIGDLTGLEKEMNNCLIDCLGASKEGERIGGEEVGTFSLVAFKQVETLPNMVQPRRGNTNGIRKEFWCACAVKHAAIKDFSYWKDRVDAIDEESRVFKYSVIEGTWSDREESEVYFI